MYGEKYELEIELEDICFDCPMLSLQTIRPYQDKLKAVHKCVHAGFCSVVREHWEKHMYED